MEQETKKCPFCGEEILAVAKKCKHCGEWINNNEEQKEEKEMIPCPICGELIEEGTIRCPHCKESTTNEVMQESVNEEVSESQPHDQTRSFFDYYFVDPFIRQYAKFNGRINRKHFWIAMLIWWSVTMLLLIVIVKMSIHNTSGIVSDIFVLLLFIWFIGSIIPIWATTLRRMRDGSTDIGYWGWWFYIIPSPFLLWWLTRPTEDVRLDDLAPDETPKIAFKKIDKIALAIFLVIMIVGFCSSLSKGGDNEINNIKIEKLGNMSSEESSEIKIQDPYVEECSEQTTTIKAIVTSDNTTIVSFQIVPDINDTWIEISENTYIETEHQRLKLISASGIPISPIKKEGLMAGEIYDFYLFFPPIPKGTDVIDIYEDSEGGWRWMGVHLDKK